MYENRDAGECERERVCVYACGWVGVMGREREE